LQNATQHSKILGRNIESHLYFIKKLKWFVTYVTPGFNRTPIAEDFPSSPWKYSESGVFTIYENILLENLF
jgi:hypothetical protein